MKKFIEIWTILRTYLFKFLQLLDVLPFLLWLFNSCCYYADLLSYSRTVIPIGIPYRNYKPAIGSKVCVITAGIKKYKSIIKKKNKKHDKIILSAKYKLNSIETLISKALVNSVISHDEFFLINNVLKEFYGMKQEINYSNDK